MIHVDSQGNFDHLRTFLKSLRDQNYLRILDKYGKEGVLRLMAATPVDSGRTAQSWGYYIQRNGDMYDLVFTNTNIQNGLNVALLLQYGHYTGTGGYVPYRDYINPALRDIFKKLAEEVTEEVRRL